MTFHEWMHTPYPYLIGAVFVIALIVCGYLEQRDRP